MYNKITNYNMSIPINVKKKIQIYIYIYVYIFFFFFLLKFLLFYWMVSRRTGNCWGEKKGEQDWSTTQVGTDPECPT